MSTEQKSPTKLVVTGRLSYPHLNEPYAMEEGQKKKYQCSIIFPKSDKKQIAAIEAAAEAAKQLGISSKWGGKLPKQLKMPLLDGDQKDNAGTEYEDSFYLSCKSDKKPKLVRKVNGELQEIPHTEFYPGCYVKVSVNFYPDNNKSNGVFTGLQNVLFFKDGEPLSAGSNPEDDFADVLDDIDEDDDDLMG